MIANSRKGTYSIMNNRGFGRLVIVKNGFRIVLPKSSLTKKGLIKKSVAKLLKDKNSNGLQKRGVVVTKIA